MLLTSEKLLPRLREHLDASVRVDIASAWATQGPALDAMQEAFEQAKRDRKPFDVRAIIGLEHQVTTPDALKAPLRDRRASACQRRLSVPSQGLHLPPQGGR